MAIHFLLPMEEVTRSKTLPLIGSLPAPRWVISDRWSNSNLPNSGIAPVRHRRHPLLSSATDNKVNAVQSFPVFLRNSSKEDTCSLLADSDHILICTDPWASCSGFYGSTGVQRRLGAVYYPTFLLGRKKDYISHATLQINCLREHEERLCPSWVQNMVPCTCHFLPAGCRQCGSRKMMA